MYYAPLFHAVKRVPRFKKIWSGMVHISKNTSKGSPHPLVYLPKSVFSDLIGKDVYIIVYVIEEEGEGDGEEA